MSRRLRASGVAFALLFIGGCTSISPFEAKRWWADWNTERHCNAQVECFDHLPPTEMRVRLMRSGYNVGPLACPAVAPKWYTPDFWFGPYAPSAVIGGTTSFTTETRPGDWNPAPAAETSPESTPLIPPAPPMEPTKRSEEQGPQINPTGEVGPGVTSASYEVPSISNARRRGNASWMFVPQRPRPR
jgi:hypothetical protein